MIAKVGGGRPLIVFFEVRQVTGPEAQSAARLGAKVSRGFMISNSGPAISIILRQSAWLHLKTERTIHTSNVVRWLRI